MEKLKHTYLVPRIFVIRLSQSVMINVGSNGASESEQLAKPQQEWPDDADAPESLWQ